MVRKGIWSVWWFQTVAVINFHIYDSSNFTFPLSHWSGDPREHQTAVLLSVFIVTMQLWRRWPRFPAFASADSVPMLDAGTCFASLLFAHLVFSQGPPHSQSSEAQANAHQKIRHNMQQTSCPPPQHDTETSYCCCLIIYS